MFLVFAAISAVFLGVVLLFVPETEGKSYIQHVENNASYKIGFLWGKWDLRSSDIQEVEKKAPVTLTHFEYHNYL
jgi:hypothetical protein